MAVIPSSVLDSYRNTAQASGRQASSYVAAALAALLSEFPDMSVAELREEAKTTVEDALYVYGTAASMAAFQLIEAISQITGSTLPTEQATIATSERIDSEIRWITRHLVEGDQATWIRQIAQNTQYWVESEGFQTLYESSKKSGRFARVPSGSETCGFCLTLASRGYVYESEFTAGGKGNSYHRNCDCVIVPYTGAEIEGYDPGQLLEDYEKAVDTVNSMNLREIWDNMSDAARNQYKGGSDTARFRRFRDQEIFKTMAANSSI